jgi:hypothetical protein
VRERLGEILVRERACTDAAVRDALKNQIIFGGRLGTNLLEIQAVTEEALARALGRQHGLPSVHGDVHAEPIAVSLLSPEVADRCDAIPIVLKDRRLGVIVVDPGNVTTLDELAFATGRAVHPIVAPEARVWALLRKHYGIDRHLRGIEVDFEHLQRIAQARSLEPVVRPPAAGVGDLMDESEFEALYERQLKPQGAATPPPMPAATATPVPAGTLGRPSPTPTPTSTSTRSATAAPWPGARVTPLPAAPPPAPPPDDVVELTDLLEEEPAPAPPPRPATAPPGPVPRPRVTPEMEAQVLAALSERPGHAPPIRLAAARPEPEPSPLSFSEATRFLEGVGERDAIAKTVLRYARSRFRRALLLTVHRGNAHGWAGLGEKVVPQVVRRIHLVLGQPGILDTVVRTRAHFLGPIPRTEANIRLLKALGGGVPKNAFVLPILAMGRVVNVFYGDNGRGGTVDSGEVGELLILATRIAQSYDALLAQVR